MGYDDWLERPYQQAWAQDDRTEELNEFVGLMVLDEDDEAWLVKEFEVEDEADEDGGYTVITFMCKSPGQRTTRSMTLDEIVEGAKRWSAL